MKIRWEEESKEYNEDRISNKVIFLRVGAIILIIIALILFIVLIYKSLKIINKDNESEVIETTIIETKKKKSLVTLKEKRKVVVEEKAEDNNKDNEISIFKYVDNLKRRINKQSSKEINNDIVVDIKSSGEEEEQ